MNNKYNIDGVEYEYGEEVEVSDDNESWSKGNIAGYDKNHDLPVKTNNVLNKDWEYGWKYIRKIQPTQCEHESDGSVYTSLPPKYKCKKCGEFYPTLASYEGSSGRFIYGEQSLSGRKATLILEGTEHTVTFE